MPSLNHFMNADSISECESIEAKLALIWAEVLKVSNIDSNDNFFLLGGDSLLATRLAWRVRSELGVDLNLADFFQCPTLGEQGRVLVALLHRMGKSSSQKPHHVQDGSVWPKSESQLLSYSQERIWLHQQLKPESVTYNRPTNIRLRGPLHFESLRQAIEDIVRRHKVLRSTVQVSNGVPVSRIREGLRVELPQFDLSEESSLEFSLRRRMEIEAAASFDLGKDLPWRASLVRIGTEENILLLTFHHLVFDAASESVLLDELARFYGMRAAGLGTSTTAIEFEYSDFAISDRNESRLAALEKGRSYWRNKLVDPPVLQLPKDFPQTGTTSEAAGHVLIELPDQLPVQLLSLAVTERTTLFTVLLAVFKVILHRYTGQTDLIVGCPAACRGKPEVDSLIGVFINTLPLRTQIKSDDTFRQFLQRVRETHIEGLQNQDVPYQFIVQDVYAGRSRDKIELFQAGFVFERLSTEPRIAAGLTIEPILAEPVATSDDLWLELRESAGKISGYFVYRRNLWEVATIQRLRDHYLTLLKAIATSPDESLSLLPLMTTEEKKSLDEWSIGGTTPIPDRRLDICVIEQAKKTPEAVALICASSGEQLSYRELEMRVSRLASRLHELGIYRESRVGLVAGRSTGVVCGMIAAMKAGSTVVALDPDWPRARLDRIMADCLPSVILATQAEAPDWVEFGLPIVEIDNLKEGIVREPDRQIGDTRDAALIIYTSGTTGDPNGVVLEHRSLMNYCQEMQRLYGTKETDRGLLFSPLTFDSCIDEIFVPLISGATLVIRSESASTSIRAFVEECQKYGVTISSLPTAFWHLLSEEVVSGRLNLPDHLRLVSFGGEAADPTQVANWCRHFGSRTRILNGYGPTEASVASTYCDLTDYSGPVNISTVPIGRPIGNTRVYVLDPFGRQTPIGVPGELYIGGAGLARGYLNRPELTASRFLPNPFSDRSGERLYKTGDRGRFRSDGHLEYLGRMDGQVKLRGFRIEIGEVEAALGRHPAIQQATVILREDRPGDKKLVGYFVAAGDGDSPLETDLRAFLEGCLPGYMVPSVLLRLPNLPLNRNGKVDRNALPLPGNTRRFDNLDFASPRNEIERSLANLWEEVLGIAPIGIDDDFFQVGGHSLLVVRLMARIENDLGVRLPISSLLEAPTIEKMARLVVLGKQQSEGKSHSKPQKTTRRIVPLQEGNGLPPLFLIPGAGGHVISFRELAMALGAEWPIFGLQPSDYDLKQLSYSSVETLASALVEDLLKVEADGPFYLLGYSAGGLIAFEIAQKLIIDGKNVALLGLIDTYGPGYPRPLPFRIRLIQHLRKLQTLQFLTALKYTFGRIGTFLNRLLISLHGMGTIAIRSNSKKVVNPQTRTWSWDDLRNRYKPRTYAGCIDLFRGEDPNYIGADFGGSTLGWDRLVKGEVKVHPIQGQHLDLVKRPFVYELAAKIRKCLA